MFAEIIHDKEVDRQILITILPEKRLHGLVIVVRVTLEQPNYFDITETTFPNTPRGRYDAHNFYAASVEAARMADQLFKDLEKLKESIKKGS